MASPSDLPRGVPINPDPNPPYAESAVAIYGYIPSEALATIALITFGLALLNHVVHLIRLRGTRVFQGLLVFGCACEIVGYASRLFAHYHPFTINYYIVQYFFIVVSPVFFQGAFYMALGIALRRLDHHGSTLLRFEPRILVAAMVISDVVTTIIQVVGAALIGVAEAATYSASRTSSLSSSQANVILLAGLAIQTASFCAFLILLGLCIYRSHRTFSAAHLPRQFSSTLFLASLLVFLRTTFRLAETAQGVFGFASRSEALFGCLEYLPIILAISLFAAVPLHDVLPYDYDDEKSFRSSNSRTMSMRQPTKENRTLDLRGTSTHGSEIGGRSGEGSRSGSGNNSPRNGAVSEKGREKQEEEEEDDGFAAEKRAAAERMHSRGSASEGIREGDEDEGVVTDESPTTMVDREDSNGSSPNPSAASGSGLSRRNINGKKAGSFRGSEEGADRY
ncbi:hypothetical protein JCM10908_007168 [Rhodotorula pacifica]|uniref:RTA1 domain-containing protein n=1 Tax=Rhodotorula pacifica TaxID=1495444 RepID=UPI003178668F